MGDLGTLSKGSSLKKNGKQSGHWLQGSNLSAKKKYEERMKKLRDLHMKRNEARKKRLMRIKGVWSLVIFLEVCSLLNAHSPWIMTNIVKVSWQVAIFEVILPFYITLLKRRKYLWNICGVKNDPTKLGLFWGRKGEKHLLLPTAASP